MAFYLHRAFAADSALQVLNDLRLVDDQQPEADGSPGVCQIDHLVLHRWGAFIIESKSVSEEVTVTSDGSGGDVWARRYRGREEGMPSPIQQARRQAEFLRSFLQRHRVSLLGKTPAGTRTLAKLILGSDQRGFTNMPMQLLVAISDRGRLDMRRDWAPPTEPFRTFVTKADLVADKIRSEFEHHRQQSAIVRQQSDKYGMWFMQSNEVPVVATFLNRNHSPRAASLSQQPVAASPPVRIATAPIRDEAGAPPQDARSASPTAVSAKPACKTCASTDLDATWGKYGYYWKCRACGDNTAMPTVCSACGGVGVRGQGVRIRKEGPKYFRDCQTCGISERIWTQS